MAFFHSFSFLKSIQSALCLAFVVYAKAQDVPLSLSVSNSKKTPCNNASVTLKNKASGLEFKTLTNKKGQAQVQLFSGASYGIYLNTPGEDLYINDLELPKLKEGERFSKMHLEITYEPAQNFTLDAVYFETGKAQLLPASFEELNELVNMLQIFPDMIIEVAGHTDNVGSDASNTALSLARANSVKAYLSQKGIKAQRIQAKGYGATRPVAENTSPEGRQKNRRTTVQILKN